MTTVAVLNGTLRDTKVGSGRWKEGKGWIPMIMRGEVSSSIIETKTPQGFRGGGRGKAEAKERKASDLISLYVKLRVGRMKFDKPHYKKRGCIIQKKAWRGREEQPTSRHRKILPSA